MASVSEGHCCKFKVRPIEQHSRPKNKQNELHVRVSFPLKKE
jgi:hypothetical protein